MEEGFVPFTTQWGQDQELSAQWFTDTEESKPLDAIREFEGPLLVLYGDQDEVVLPRVCGIRDRSSGQEPGRREAYSERCGPWIGIIQQTSSHYSEEAVVTTVEFLSSRL